MCMYDGIAYRGQNMRFNIRKRFELEIVLSQIR